MSSRNQRTILSITTTFVLVAVVLAFGATSALTTFTHKANAQMMGSTMGTMAPNSMMANRVPNINGSVPILPAMIDALKPRVHTSLNDATTAAINSVGGNSSAVAAFIRPENGFLVYNVIVLDASNNIHRVIVDVGNGKVLSSQSMSMTNMMMGSGMGMMGQ